MLLVGVIASLFGIGLIVDLEDTRLEDPDLRFRRFGVAAQNRLRNYPWPGNVRELRALVRRLLVTQGPEATTM